MTNGDNRGRGRAGLLTVGLVLAGVAVVTAGPLNPPSGPVSPTGKTTDEIFSAIQGIAGMVGGQDGCRETRGGMPRTHTPTASFAAGANTPAFNFDLVSMTYVGEQVFSSSGPGGTAESRYLIQSFVLVREAGPNSNHLHRMVTTGSNVPGLVVKMGTAAAPMTYDLKVVGVQKVEHEMGRRCDGTHVQLERIHVTAREIQVGTSQGAWNWNIQTNTGG